MKVKKVLIILLAVALVLSCATSESAEEVIPSYTITLEGNPTTGFIWEYVAEGSGSVELINEAIISQNQDENLVGAPSLFTFSFRGVKPGRVNLIFEYARPWEGGEKLETRIYSIVVNDDLTITGMSES